MSNFSIKQLYVLYKPPASVQARCKLINICQKKVKEYFFRFYTETAGKHETWTKHFCDETVITATFLQLDANYAMLLNQSNFSAFKFSNVSYCFAMKAMKHKISETVKLYNLAQKRSIRLYKTASSLHLGTRLLAKTKPNSVSSTAI